MLNVMFLYYPKYLQQNPREICILLWFKVTVRVNKVAVAITLGRESGSEYESL